MTKELKTIELETAREIAAKYAYADLKDFSESESECLEQGQLEAESCWMFFPNRMLNIPPESRLGIKWAYVVSKKGTFSLVQDLSDDPERLREYIKKLSEYFSARGE